jgi:hypothetical protein
MTRAERREAAQLIEAALMVMDEKKRRREATKLLADRVRRLVAVGRPAEAFKLLTRDLPCATSY